MSGRRLSLLALACAALAACANIGSPDGGDYDETPPKVAACSPADRSLGNTGKKIRILFDEYIKLQSAAEKVIVSPPQVEPANIRAEGKRVKVDLFDDLKPRTTYTIDFSDAIEDNNEGNPMGRYTYSFSTGEEIDTMEVSGSVLNAADLEPVKGILVGLYPADSAFSDTLLTTTPFTRVSRTNGSGKFTIKGVRAGRYRAYALEDKDGTFTLSQKSERLAFDTAAFNTYGRPDLRYDTIWRDSTRFDSIRVVPYTHYYPDDLTLTAFLEDGQDRHLLKTERAEPEAFTLYFTAPQDTLPTLRGLNFDERCLVAESAEHHDTITYWVTDTAVCQRSDTLVIALSYMETDTLGGLTLTTDTLELTPKLSYEKKSRERQKQIDDWNKEREKQQKKAKGTLPHEENPYTKTFLEISAKPSGSLDPNQNVRYTAKEPLALVDTAKLHFYAKKDSDWLPAPFLFLPDGRDGKSRTLYAEWEPGGQYRFAADSAAFTSVMGHSTKAIRQDFKVRGEDEFGTIFARVLLPDTGVVVQLVNKQDKPVAEQRADAGGRADFYYLKPNDYYLRCFVDRNGNGKWDTGNYARLQAPEEVFYFPKPLRLKAKFELSQDWEPRAIALDRQKPAEITKQKPDKKKPKKDRNKERQANNRGQSRGQGRGAASNY